MRSCTISSWIHWMNCRQNHDVDLQALHYSRWKTNGLFMLIPQLRSWTFCMNGVGAHNCIVFILHFSPHHPSHVEVIAMNLTGDNIGAVSYYPYHKDSKIQCRSIYKMRVLMIRCIHSCMYTRTHTHVRTYTYTYTYTYFHIYSRQL